MKRRIIIHLIVILITVIGGGMLAEILIGTQAKISVAKSAFSPHIAGFNKFASDIQWMLLINYFGSIERVDDENSDKIYKKLKTIVDNDPNFEKAYEMASLMLSAAAPLKAVDILQKGIDNRMLSHNWRLPFYAGFTVSHYYPEKDSTKTLKIAEDYFKEAMKRCEHLEKSVISQLIYVKSKIIKNNKNYKGVKITSDRHARLCALYDEWKKAAQKMRNMEYIDSGNHLQIDLEQMLLSTAQSAKRSDPENPDLLKTIDLVKKDVFLSQHLCENCLSTYSKGDKFCATCGQAVEVYGICHECGSTTKGKFCSSCGADTEAK